MTTNDKFNTGAEPFDYLTTLAHHILNEVDDVSNIEVKRKIIVLDDGVQVGTALAGFEDPIEAVGVLLTLAEGVLASMGLHMAIVNLAELRALVQGSKPHTEN